MTDEVVVELDNTVEPCVHVPEEIVEIDTGLTLKERLLGDTDEEYP